MTEPAKRGRGRPRNVEVNARHAITIEPDPDHPQFHVIVKLTIADDGRILDKRTIGENDRMKGLFSSGAVHDAMVDTFIPDKRRPR